MFMANGAAARMNAKGGHKPDEMKKPTMKTEALMTALEEPKVEEEAEVTETEKVGRPMQGDRLNRLKGAVRMLKEALGDLRSGSVSMEKFRKVGDVLGALINELQINKAAAAAITGGIEDTRSASPEAPNSGSGVQPDTSVVADVSAVAGEGTGQLGAILKEIEGLKTAQKEQETAIQSKEAENAKLRKELASLKKARSAPSTVPTDGDEELITKSNDQVDEGSSGWPRDMNDWNKD